MRQLVSENENSEFKPVKLRLKIDFVSYLAREEGLVNMVKRSIGIQWKKRDHQDYSIAEFGQNTENSPGDVRKLALTHTTEKSPAKVVGKWNGFILMIIKIINFIVKENELKIVEKEPLLDICPVRIYRSSAAPVYIPRVVKICF